MAERVRKSTVGGLSIGRRPASVGDDASLWVFAGQGSERPLMAAGLRCASDLFKHVRELVGLDLEYTCSVESVPFWHPASLQTALLTVCVAISQGAFDLGRRPKAVLGHSFGEYAALVTAGALTFDDAVRLTTIRGRAMSALADERTGMIAILGLSVATVERICAETQSRGADAFIATRNSPTQTVISGDLQALNQVAADCRAADATRTRRLPIPFAAHSPAMSPAVARLAEALDRATIRVARVPVYSCVDAEPSTAPDHFREVLLRSLTEPVRFREAVAAVARAGDLARVCELGPGPPPRLLGLIRETLTTDWPDSHLPPLSLITCDDDLPFGRPFSPLRKPAVEPSSPS
jgi:[acyl-carrier-protein] S-malonyltransferase